MMKLLIKILVLTIWSSFVALSADDELTKDKRMCKIETSQGDIILELYPNAAPLTVANFIGLAIGTKPYKDPKTQEDKKGNFYDGLIFHRVMKGFMIQGGCPLGNGMGGPGFAFKDEINATGLGLDKLNAQDPRMVQGAAKEMTLKELGVKGQDDIERIGEEKLNAVYNKHMKDLMTNKSLKEIYELSGYSYDDKLSTLANDKGTISMANSGPNTNGSQFFINSVDNHFLNGKHTVFGRVVKGMEVVTKIENVEVDQGSKPIEEVKIITIRELSEEEASKLLK